MEHDEDHEKEAAADFDAVVASQVSRKGKGKPYQPLPQSKLQDSDREGQRKKSAAASTAALRAMARRAAQRLMEAVETIEKINLRHKKIAASKEENPMGTSHDVGVVEKIVSDALAQAGIEELSSATSKINIDEVLPKELGQVRQAFGDLERELIESKQVLGGPKDLDAALEATKTKVAAKAQAIIVKMPQVIAGKNPVGHEQVGKKDKAASLRAKAVTECLAAAHESVMSLRLGMKQHPTRGVPYDTVEQIKQSLSTARFHLNLLSHLGVSARDKGPVDVLRAELEQLLGEQANTTVNQFEAEWDAFRTIAKQVLAKVTKK